MRIYQELSNKNVVDIRVRSNSRWEQYEPQFTFKTVFNGCQRFQFKDKEIKLFPDSFILLPPGSVYSTTIDSIDAVKTFSISIAGSFISRFKKEHEIGGSFFDETASGFKSFSLQSIHPIAGDMYYNVWNMCQRMEELNNDESLMNEYINHFLKIYYRNYYKGYEARLQRLNFTRTNTKKDVLKRVMLAKEFISNNYNTSFKLEEVASASCLSVNHLLRTFKQAFGLSPFQYLTFIRLNRAKKMLETTDSSINEIVFEVGFESPSSFIRAFKEYFNITPLKHRKAIISTRSGLN